VVSHVITWVINYCWILVQNCSVKLVPSKVDEGPTKIAGTAGKFHGNPVQGNHPYKRLLTSTVTVKELQWRNLPDLIPTVNRFLSEEGWALNWQNGWPKQWSTKLNWASKLQNLIWWPKQQCVQVSDPQRSAEPTIANIPTRAHMRAFGKVATPRVKESMRRIGLRLI